MPPERSVEVPASQVAAVKLVLLAAGQPLEEEAAAYAAVAFAASAASAASAAPASVAAAIGRADSMLDEALAAGAWAHSAAACSSWAAAVLPEEASAVDTRAAEHSLQEASMEAAENQEEERLDRDDEERCRASCPMDHPERDRHMARDRRECYSRRLAPALAVGASEAAFEEASASAESADAASDAVAAGQEPAVAASDFGSTAAAATVHAIARTDAEAERVLVRVEEEAAEPDCAVAAVHLQAYLSEYS